MVVAPRVGGGEAAAFLVVRGAADELLGARPRQRADGVAEAEPSERGGLAAAWAEARAPQQALCLGYPEPSPVDVHHCPYRHTRRTA